MLLNEAKEEFNHYLISVLASPKSTYLSYMNDIKQYISYLQENNIFDISDITYDKIQDFLKQQQQIKKDSSINHMITTIKTFHNYISSTYTNYHNPAIFLKSKKGEQKLPYYFTYSESKTILESFGNSDKDKLDKAMLEAVSYTHLTLPTT